MSAIMAPRREGEIQRAILELLRALRIPAWRQNSGAFVLESKQGARRFFRSAIMGASDIVGILPPRGRMLAIEVKRPPIGKLTPAQALFLQTVREAGGVAFVATSPQDVTQHLAWEGWPER